MNVSKALKLAVATVALSGALALGAQAAYADQVSSGSTGSTTPAGTPAPSPSPTSGVVLLGNDPWD